MRGVKVGVLVGINIAHEYSKVLSSFTAEYSPNFTVQFPPTQSTELTL